MAQIIWIAAADGSEPISTHWYEYTGLSEVESLGWEFQGDSFRRVRGKKSEGAGLENKVSASLKAGE